MNQFLAFTKKELRESAATFRIYILLAVFFLFGVMGPLLAVLTPVILEMVAVEGSGITITVPDPTAADSWMQFFSNFSQMGSLAIMFLFAGIMANEFSRGTLVNLLTKGLKRHTVVLSKFFSSALLWTIAIVLSIGVCYMYTAFYFETEVIPHFALVFVAPWLFGLFMISLLIFGGTLTGGFGGSIGIGLGVFFTLVFANMVPGFDRYNPISLSSSPLNLITGAGTASDLLPAILVAAASIILMIVGTIVVFNKKKV